MAGLDAIINEKINGMRGMGANPQQVAQKSMQQGQLLEALAAQKLVYEKQKAQQEMQAAMQTEPRTVAEQNDTALKEMSMQDMAKQVGGLARMQAAKQQQMGQQQRSGPGMPTQAPAPKGNPMGAGLAGLPAQNMAPKQMAAGGIVNFATGGMPESSHEEAYRSEQDLIDAIKAEQNPENRERLIMRLMQMRKSQPQRPQNFDKGGEVSSSDIEAWKRRNPRQRSLSDEEIKKRISEMRNPKPEFANEAMLETLRASGRDVPDYVGTDVATRMLSEIKDRRPTDQAAPASTPAASTTQPATPSLGGVSPNGSKGDFTPDMLLRPQASAGAGGSATDSAPDKDTGGISTLASASAEYKKPIMGNFEAPEIASGDRPEFAPAMGKLEDIYSKDPHEEGKKITDAYRKEITNDELIAEEGSNRKEEEAFLRAGFGDEKSNRRKKLIRALSAQPASRGAFQAANFTRAYMDEGERQRANQAKGLAAIGKNTTNARQSDFDRRNAAAGQGIGQIASMKQGQTDAASQAASSAAKARGQDIDVKKSNQLAAIKTQELNQDYGFQTIKSEVEQEANRIRQQLATATTEDARIKLYHSASALMKDFQDKVEAVLDNDITAMGITDPQKAAEYKSITAATVVQRMMPQFEDLFAFGNEIGQSLSGLPVHQKTMPKNVSVERLK